MIRSGAAPTLPGFPRLSGLFGYFACRVRAWWETGGSAPALVRAGGGRDILAGRWRNTDPPGFPRPSGLFRHSHVGLRQGSVAETLALLRAGYGRSILDACWRNADPPGFLRPSGLFGHFACRVLAWWNGQGCGLCYGQGVVAAADWRKRAVPCGSALTAGMPWRPERHARAISDQVEA